MLESSLFIVVTDKKLDVVGTWIVIFRNCFYLKCYMRIPTEKKSSIFGITI